MDNQSSRLVTLCRGWSPSFDPQGPEVGIILRSQAKAQVRSALSCCPLTRLPVLSLRLHGSGQGYPICFPSSPTHGFPKAGSITGPQPLPLSSSAAPQPACKTQDRLPSASRPSSGRGSWGSPPRATVPLRPHRLCSSGHESPSGRWVSRRPRARLGQGPRLFITVSNSWRALLHSRWVSLLLVFPWKPLGGSFNFLPTHKELLYMVPA